MIWFAKTGVEPTHLHFTENPSLSLMSANVRQPYKKGLLTWQLLESRAAVVHLCVKWPEFLPLLYFHKYYMNK